MKRFIVFPILFIFNLLIFFILDFYMESNSSGFLKEEYNIKHFLYRYEFWIFYSILILILTKFELFVLKANKLRIKEYLFLASTLILLNWKFAEFLINIFYNFSSYNFSLGNIIKFLYLNFLSFIIIFIISSLSFLELILIEKLSKYGKYLISNK